MGPIFSGGAEFTRLWAEIPKVVTYWDYIGLANEIDDYRQDRRITDFDERFLLECLERWKALKKIKTP